MYNGFLKYMRYHIPNMNGIKFMLHFKEPSRK